MKKVFIRKVFCAVLLGVVVASSSGNVTYAQTSKVMNTKISNNKESLRAYANGDIVGNGVRLRSKPSTSGTILESMYDGEEVWIDFDKSWAESNGTWYYITRLQTGTKGWVDARYLASWSRILNE